MADPIFKDSIYNFTDPIRYFKANDPYYWEVENIPLKQIHENLLWLKDQIGPQDKSFANVTRRDLSELKPYVSGEDNVVKVMSGRYTARINNAYELDNPMQIMELVTGADYGHLDRWKLKLLSDTNISAIVNKFKTRVVDNYLGMNGLVERAFAYPTFNEDFTGSWVDFNTGPHHYDLGGPGGSPRWKRAFPLTDGTQLADGVNGSSEFEMQSPRSDMGFYNQSHMATHFIRRWRGVARTAVVDIPEELSITIPSFNAKEYFYEDESGETQFIEGVENRIDLLFIYSKPVDTSSVYVGEYIENSPTKITKAELGLVHGAGVGLRFTSRDSNVEWQPEPLQNSEGKSSIIPNASDQLMTDAGFKKLGPTKSGIYGSFPAPDDLMNISPLLAEDIESNSPLLMGQTIMPIAYIVTTLTDEENGVGTNILTEDSIIDIRPFLRTAELAYNERAGIAAAMPQLSNANPAVGKGQLDLEIYNTKSYIDAHVDSLNSKFGGGGERQTARVVGSGYIFGGSLYGVESAMADGIRKADLAGNTNAVQYIKEMTSLPDEAVIPEKPQWDLANWTSDKDITSSKGQYPCDWINTHISAYMSEDLDEGLPADYGSKINRLGDTARHFGMNNVRGTGSWYPNYHAWWSMHTTNIHYVKKKIWISNREGGTMLDWMQDYHVDVQYWNCAPLSNVQNMGVENLGNAAGTASLWVDKAPTHFTIYASWCATDFLNAAEDEEQFTGIKGRNPNNWRVPRNLRDRGDLYAGHSVINQNLDWHRGQGKYGSVAFRGETQAGVCIYPTITFTITGIPKESSSRRAHLIGGGAQAGGKDNAVYLR